MTPSLAALQERLPALMPLDQRRLGRRIDRVLLTTITFIPSAFDVATGDPRLGGAIVDVDPETGRALAIRRVMLDEAKLAELQPPAAAEIKPLL